MWEKGWKQLRKAWPAGQGASRWDGRGCAAGRLRLQQQARQLPHLNGDDGVLAAEVGIEGGHLLARLLLRGGDVVRNTGRESVQGTHKGKSQGTHAPGRLQRQLAMQAEWWAAREGPRQLCLCTEAHSVGNGSGPAANRCTGCQRGRTWLPSLSLPLKLRSYLPSSPAQGLITPAHVGCHVGNE